MATINVMSSNSTYLFKGTAEFERTLTVDGAATFAGGVTFNTSPLTLSSNYIVESVATATSDDAISAYGVTIVRATTAGGAGTRTLAAPIVGVRKTIICLTANSSDTVVVDATSDVIISNSTLYSKNKITFTSPGVIELIGVTTAQYGILNVGNAALVDMSSTIPALSS